ncbi:MAG: cytoplasmic rane protein [Hymenobacter sp.]|nr:cytoplasmic rane protein [Hymenobacter sp.]
MKLLLLLLLTLSLKVSGQSNKEEKFDTIEAALVLPASVKSLDLSDKGLKGLPTEVEQLSNLAEIDISSNPTLDLVQAFEVLGKLKNLKTLWLTDSKISDVPVQIAALKGLEELWLDDNNFSVVPNSVRLLKNLKYVSFFNNNISKLNLRKGDFPNLNQINLCYNKFNIFPTELSMLPQLKRIVIWGDSMTIVPKSIKKLRNIEEINMEINYVSSFPKSISKLKHLKNLTAQQNNLTEQSIMPLYKLKNLQTLGLSNNCILHVKPQIGELKQLINLDLSSNPLTDLPVELGKLKSLQQLGLTDLPALNWDSTFNIIEGLPNLRRVGMAFMKRSKMPNSFARLRQVEIFWMNGNYSFDKDEQERIKRMLPDADINFK